MNTNNKYDLAGSPDVLPSDNATDATMKTPKWKERYIAKYPDKSIEDESIAQEELFRDYDLSLEELGKLQSDNQKIYQLMIDNPELGQIMGDLAKGVPLKVALAKIFDPEELAITEGDDDYEAYAKAMADRKTMQAEKDYRKKMFDENSKKTSAAAEEFFTDKTDKDRDGFIDFMDSFSIDLYNGLVSINTLKKLWQAYKYDEDITTATEVARISGRNDQIEMKREKRKAVDGLPETNTSATPDVKRQVNERILPWLK